MANLLWELAIGFIAILAVGMALYATSYSIGTNVDSATYLMAAHNLLAGKGLTLQFIENGPFVPMTAFPPGYPIALAAIGVWGFNLLSAARWLNAILFGLNVLLVAYIARRCTGSSMASVFAALLTATTVDVLQIHTNLISEPLFFAAVLAGLILTSYYVESPSFSALLLFSAAFGFAAAVRYVGVSLLPAGMGAIWFATMPRRRKWTHLGAYAAIFGLPITLWVTRNLVTVHAFSNRTFAFHPPTITQFAFSVLSLSTWLIPAAVPVLLRIVVLFAGIALAFRGLLKRNSRTQALHALTAFRFVSALFLVSYVSAFMVAQTFFDAQIWFAGRHLLPVYVVGSLLVIFEVYESVPRMSQRIQFAIVCAGCGVIALTGVRGARSTHISHEAGIGFSSRRWQTSGLVSQIRQLDASIPLISNSRSAVYLFTGRIAYTLPSTINTQTEETSPHYGAEMKQLADRMRNTKAILILFTGFDSKQPASSEENLEKQLGLRRLAVTNDGYLLQSSE